MQKVEMKYEEALAQLEAIVDKMEKGEMTLDESIESFQKGIELSKYCSQRLDDVEKRITLLIEGEKDAIKEEEFSPIKDEE